MTWKSAIAGAVQVSLRVAHAHPACGNGVAWWLEHRRGGRATVLGEGAVDLGKEVKSDFRSVKVAAGDVLVLAVDARDNSHVCDMAEIEFAVTSASDPERVWDLAADVSGSVQAENPHADQHGHADTWSFVFGASKGASAADAIDTLIPAASVLGQWRRAASDPERQDDLAKLAADVQALLASSNVDQAGELNRALYGNLLAVDGPLFKGLDVSRLAKPRPRTVPYGLSIDRFGNPSGGQSVDDASLAAEASSITEVRLPTALVVGREFVVDGRLDGAPGDRVVQVQVLTSPPENNDRAVPSGPVPSGPVLAAADSEGYQRLLHANAEFRSLFPLFLCFPGVIPNDEVVSLKMFHREDEPLARLFLDEAHQAELDHLWNEHRFISRQAVAENNYLPLFIGFVTQDQPRAMFDVFEGQRPAFLRRADELLKLEAEAVPGQLSALVDFTARAYRRPLTDSEKTDLFALYESIHARTQHRDETFRRVLARVLISPAFLFRIERAPAGQAAQPINDWELATRLSYFLWSRAPHGELRSLAASGQLRDPQLLDAQVRRTLNDDRLRSLAIDFGTQWIHVRGFDEFNEKNESVFPTFDRAFRAAAYEESILFFQDLFQNDRPVTQVLDADYALLNESLARHYGIPGVSGSEFRRVTSVREFGRGGVLGMATVLSRQAGASRSSPVLRGNWVIETLLGEKLPRPPKDVPQLPENEGGLTMRQQVEKHASVESCKVCHIRIDPFGFALEDVDAIGRRCDQIDSESDLDTTATLRDGIVFQGAEGLRNYLLTRKKDVVVRLFCRRLLGYALGPSLSLSDTSLLDQMVAELNRNDGRVSAAVLTIVRSPQFQMIRGSEFDDHQ